MSQWDKFGYIAFRLLVATAALAAAFIALLIVAVVEHERTFERCGLNPPGWKRPATGYHVEGGACVFTDRRGRVVARLRPP